MDQGAVANSRAHKIHHRFINKLVVTDYIRGDADSARDLTALAFRPEYQPVRGYFDGQKPMAPAAITQDKKVTNAIWESRWN